MSISPIKKKQGYCLAGLALCYLHVYSAYPYKVQIEFSGSVRINVAPLRFRGIELFWPSFIATYSLVFWGSSAALQGISSLFILFSDIDQIDHGGRFSSLLRYDYKRSECAAESSSAAAKPGIQDARYDLLL